MKKVVIIGRKTGHIGSVLKHAELTFIFHMVQILPNLEVMHLFILADRDRIIFHNDTTISKAVCLSNMDLNDELNSFPYSETIDGAVHNYRVTENGNHFGIERDGVVITEVAHDDHWRQLFRRTAQ
jgi:hypothetical protein